MTDKTEGINPQMKAHPQPSLLAAFDSYFDRFVVVKLLCFPDIPSITPTLAPSHVLRLNRGRLTLVHFTGTS